MKLPNFVVRVLAGAVFVGLLVGGILYSQYTFAILFALIIALGLYEFYGLIEKNAKVKVSKWLNIAGGLLFFGGAWLYAMPCKCIEQPGLQFFIPYAVFLLTLFISELYLKREDPIKSLAYSILGQIYIVLPFTLTIYLTFSHGSYNSVFILAVLIFIWVNDSFAYLTGMTFGKHRLFERISPKKSWEGFIGGAVFAMISSYLFFYFDPAGHAMPLLFWVGFAAVTVIFGTWGDLIESLIKRTLGVKDSGNMIPGHGGLLDRFDSTILAIPAVSIYLSIYLFF